ncbi:hypothetical protein QNH98_11395 [Myroides sp. mNGS23_01]|nr:hypothetical protein [Myroides sp. mNGS23_01]WHT37765.1 hypothetical protein QNH98_11395 [Myroides sp. mNGS23_01]
MKLFSQNPDKRIKIKPVAYFLLLIFSYSCATLSPQQRGNNIASAEIERKNSVEIAHTYYFVGGLLAAKSQEEQAHLEQLTQVFNQADKKSTLVLLGDNIQKNSSKTKKMHSCVLPWIGRSNLEAKLFLSMEKQSGKRI